jgi:RNase P/RNase MRP subunit p29
MASDQAVQIRWLNQPATGTAGMTWGIPWQEGELQREEPLQLQAANNGELIPMQSWPTAYWPDGSVKWSAHAAVASATAAGGYSVAKGTGIAADIGVTATETETTIKLDTGVMQCVIGKQGQELLLSLARGGETLCSGGRLISLRESRSRLHDRYTVTEELFSCRIRHAVIEQSGPVRAVVKVEGIHRQENGAREWLPFSLRIYAYAGQESLRIVHTFHYDGNPDEDFVKGLGIRFAVPLRGPLYNRHVRLAGDNGIFSESPKTLHTRRTKGKYRELFERQTRGEAVRFDESEEDRYFVSLLADSAVWDDFKLVQRSAEHYGIWKRTQQECCWLKSAEGRRAGGLAYIGSEGGGLAAGLRNFWEKHPAALAISGTAGETAQLTLWFWSPDGEAMDLRHYDTTTHVESSYEGAEELRATPYGIANTSELTLWCMAETPAPERLRLMQRDLASPPLLACTPEYLHQTRAFGLWSLPDRSTPEKERLEKRLEGIVSFYMNEVEQRKWYGYWDYGDFMHSYDPVRHVWNYDLGGCAWQNTELVPNMWLWVMFLRTGRLDLFRLAEAMTRHTSEVDVYHFGEYAGLGSRHNVVHWGCGCKEARIAMAGLHRYYYYLTADERIGDLMDAVKDADFATVNLDPMRAYFPKDEHPTHIRIGPDWAAFSSNWMTRWERFEDTAYRDKILTGINGVKQANFGLISGPTYGYDPATSVLTPLGDDNWGRHLAICMGAPQVWFELAAMLKDPEWEAMMADFGLFYLLPQEEKVKQTGGAISSGRFDHPVLSIAIVAFGAFCKQDGRVARTAWDVLLQNPFARTDLQSESAVVTYVDELEEIDWINTNEAAQWSLNTIISLELIDSWLPRAAMEAER